MSEIKKTIEEILLKKYQTNGYITEDEIIDVCLDYDLDIIEIDAICDRILSQKIIVKDDNVGKINNDDEVIDRSQLDYESIYIQIIKEYPNMNTIIDEIRSILPPQSKEWQNLLPQAKKGNEYAKTRIVSMYLRTVLKQAYYYSKAYYVDFEEAFQTGIMGLMVAIEKYDLTRPESFVSYYPLWVRQAIQRECYPQNILLYFPAHAKDKIYKVINKIIEEIGRDEFENWNSYYSVEEVNSMSEEENISQFLILSQEIAQDDLTNENDDTVTANLKEKNLYLDKLIDDEKLTKEVFLVSLREELSEILGTLTEREQKIIKLRFGLEKGNPMTYDEIAMEFHVTGQRIQQIARKALKKLRHPSRAKRLKGYL